MKFIEQTLAEKYPHIDTSKYIWHELITTANEYGSGWHDLLIELVMKIEEIYKKNDMDITEFEISQIKEKYGGLRVYAFSSIPEVHDLIHEYENKAETVCDECGATGSLHVKDGWFQVLCDKCASEEGYEKV